MGHTLVFFSLCLLAGIGCVCGLPACRADEGSAYSFGLRFSGGGSYIGSTPTLSHDGNTIVFGSPIQAGKGDICAVDLSTGRWTHLTSTPHYEGQPDVSHDGSHIAFVSEKEGLPHIFVMDADGRNVRRVTNGKHAEHSPKFSPDGSLIVFVRHFSDRADDVWSEEVCIVDVDGRNDRRLTTNDSPDYPVNVSSDNAAVYFLSGDGGFDLFSVKVKGGEARKVVALGLKGLLCDISEDERQIVFVDDREQPFQYDLFTCDLDGRNVSRRSDLKGYIGSVRFRVGSSKDVTFVLEPMGQLTRGVGDIITLDVSTGKSTKLFRNLPPMQK